MQMTYGALSSFDTLISRQQFQAMTVSLGLLFGGGGVAWFERTSLAGAR